MTVYEFNQRHGKEWDVLKKMPIFQDMLRVAENESPAVQAHKITLGELTQNAAAFTGSVAGFSLFRALLLKLGEQATGREEESSFSLTPEQQFEVDHPVQSKPAAPKTRKKK